MEEDLHLGLTLSTTTCYHANISHKKRTFSQLIFPEDQTSSSSCSSTTNNPPHPTLSLLLSLPHSDDEAVDPVGWPPVNYRRKKLPYNDDDENQRTMRNYVKVKMEGVGIARKINLTTYHSFHTLHQTLMNMFAKCDDQPYDLVYQDKEGDWLLAQDVSWRSFIQCAQRLKLLKRRG